MTSVDMKKRKRDEYEMQLFGFHSGAVNATLISLIQEKIQSRCEKLCESLEKKYKPEKDNVQILHTNGRKLARTYYRECKSQLPAIEKCVKKLINIPEYILLNEDKIQTNQYTNENFREMKNKVENLQQRLQKAIIFNAALKEEMKIAEQFDNSINSVNTACDVIENSTKYPDVNNTIIKLIESYRELQSDLKMTNGVNTMRNAKRYLTFIRKSHDTNFI